MADEWRRGGRDPSGRSSLQSGGRRGEPDEDGEHVERHIRLGVSHPSGNPDQHRTFEIRASHDAGAGGWVADVGEQDRNEQRGAWGPAVPDGRWPQAFPTAAACLGHAVTTIVALVDREATDRG